MFDLIGNVSSIVSSDSRDDCDAESDDSSRNCDTMVFAPFCAVVLLADIVGIYTKYFAPEGIILSLSQGASVYLFFKL